MRQPSLSAFVVAVLATLTLAACGGVDKNAYVDSVTKVQQTAQQGAAEINEQMADAKTPAQFAANLEALSTVIGENATDLSGIEAPDEVATEHQQYVDLMKKLSVSLDELAGKVESAKADDVSGLLTEVSKLQSDLATSEAKILNDINTKLQA